MIDQDKAIALAKEALQEAGVTAPIKGFAAWRAEGMGPDKDKSGWQVAATLDVSIDPGSVCVEVYEPDGDAEVIPMI